MFQEVKADHRSLALRKPSYGIGINDADYFTQYNGDICPYYRKWKKMLERCYSSKWQETKPTYANCSVCSEWLIFSAFKRWMKSQDWKGKELDKDILVTGNKIYSPLTCAFVSKSINLLIHNIPSKLMMGVSYHKRDKIFLSSVNHSGEREHLGSFQTEIEAHEAYKLRKYEIIREAAMKQENKVKVALLNYIIEGKI